MKKILVSGFFFFLCLTFSLAQYQQPRQQQPPQQQQAKPGEVTSAERAKSFIDHIAPKLTMTKGQKDSLTIIFTQFIDDVAKYRAENNGKVISYMEKVRDDKVKKMFHDDVKFEKYMSVMDDIKNKRGVPPKPQQTPQEGASPNPMDNGQDQMPPR